MHSREAREHYSGTAKEVPVVPVIGAVGTELECRSARKKTMIQELNRGRGQPTAVASFLR